MASAEQCLCILPLEKTYRSMEITQVLKILVYVLMALISLVKKRTTILCFLFRVESRCTHEVEACSELHRSIYLEQLTLYLTVVSSVKCL